MGTATMEDACCLLFVVPVGLVLGLINAFLFFPLLQRLAPGFRSWKRMHYTPVSDIPGIPEHYDYALVSALCTLPDPHNFVGVYGDLPCARGVKFRMRMPLCRYWSLSLYPGMFDPKQDVIPASLADHEVVWEEEAGFEEEDKKGGKRHRAFEVIISDTKPKGAKNWMPTQGIRDGLLVFRRYHVPEGVRVDYPVFEHLDDGTVAKPPYTTISGAQSMELSPNHRFPRLLKVLRFTALACLTLRFLAGRSWAEVAYVCMLMGAVPWGVNSLLWRVGSKRADAMLLDKTKGVLHQAIEPVLDFDRKSARPHPHHKYFVFEFRPDMGDIRVSGQIELGAQKIWTFCLYDDQGVPLTHRYCDETILPSSVSTVKGASVLHYTVLLTRDPRYHLDRGERNVMDTSHFTRRGVGIVRLIYPRDQATFEAAKPTIQVLKPAARQAGDGSRGKAKSS